MTNSFDDALRSIIRQENNALKQSIEEMISDNAGVKNQVMNFKEFCNYVGCSRSHAYKLTSNRLVPFSRKNGKLWFLRSEIDEWLMSNPVKTKTQIDNEAGEYLISKRKGGKYE